MRASWPTPSADSVSAAWRSVAQSDWLPMMIATGFAPIPASEHAFGSAKEAVHYRFRMRSRKLRGISAPWAPRRGQPGRQSGDNIGGELVLDERNAVPQLQLALFKSLNLQEIAA